MNKEKRSYIRKPSEFCFYDYKTYEKDSGKWSYDLGKFCTRGNKPFTLIASTEYFQSEGEAELAAIGHMCRLQQEWV